jgi:hypothetical protein
VVHSPLVSGTHAPEQSETHDPARSAVHDPAVSIGHDPGVSLGHDPLLSTVHLEFVSVQHDPLRSSVHDPAVSTTHDVLRSQVHSPLTSSGGLDLDGNGLPDDWESLTGLTDPDGDEDMDGLTNTEEVQTWTNPNDAESVLRLVDIQRLDEGERLLKWRAAPGLRYFIQCIADINDPDSWEDVGEVVPGSAEGVFQAAPTEGPAFYRIVVRVGDE